MFYKITTQTYLCFPEVAESVSGIFSTESTVVLFSHVNVNGICDHEAGVEGVRWREEHGRTKFLSGEGFLFPDAWFCSSFLNLFGRELLISDASKSASLGLRRERDRECFIAPSALVRSSLKSAILLSDDGEHKTLSSHDRRELQWCRSSVSSTVESVISECPRACSLI